MVKGFILNNLRRNGDSVITLQEGTELRSICCTLDFSTPYIRSRLFRKNKRVPSLKNLIKVWSWTDDQVEILNPAQIKEIIPLGKILNNPAREI